jgi:hypothetical protein
MSHKNLEIWQLARELVVDIHRMTLHKLPKFEMYEEGNQIRRSSKSAKSNRSFMSLIYNRATNIQYRGSSNLDARDARFSMSNIPQVSIEYRVSSIENLLLNCNQA